MIFKTLLKSVIEWCIIIVLLAMIAQLVGKTAEYGSIAVVLFMLITARNFLIEK
jgi:hypothetical protein